MIHLSQNNIIHSDIRAVNMLVTLPNKLNRKCLVKISDFGLSKSIYSNSNLKGGEYYKNSFDLFPLRWSSPEIIKEGKYSQSSDIWSFGVLTWEIFNKGIKPFYNENIDEIIIDIICSDKIKDYLKKPEKYEDSSLKSNEYLDSLWNLIEKCWNKIPNERPNFNEIFEKLKEIENQISPNNNNNENKKEINSFSPIL